MEAHKLLVKRWSSMTAKLSSLPADPMLTRLAQERLTFLQTRFGVEGAGRSRPCYPCDPRVARILQIFKRVD